MSPWHPFVERDECFFGCLGHVHLCQQQRWKWQCDVGIYPIQGKGYEEQLQVDGTFTSLIYPKDLVARKRWLEVFDMIDGVQIHFAQEVEIKCSRGSKLWNILELKHPAFRLRGFSQGIPECLEWWRSIMRFHGHPRPSWHLDRFQVKHVCGVVGCLETQPVNGALCCCFQL